MWEQVSIFSFDAVIPSLLTINPGEFGDPRKGENVAIGTPAHGARSVRLCIWATGIIKRCHDLLRDP
jgi:hypothetical protein